MRVCPFVHNIAIYERTIPIILRLRMLSYIGGTGGYSFITYHLPHLSLPHTALHQIISLSSPHSINPSPLPPPTLHSFRRFHRIDISSFLSNLKSSRLITHPPKSLGSLLIACNTTLSSLLDKHAPVITKLTRRQSPSNPWFTSTLRAFRITVRHAAENLWKHTHSAAD